jgi:hypothetical protein
MPLRDPVAVYNAATNAEAQLLRIALVEAGIEAYATEDVSAVGIWMFGLLPEIHKPQVWVERADMARVKPILDEFEERAHERRQAAAAPADGSPIEATCEECGRSSSFPAAQRGSVQDCPHCGAYVDVGSDDVDGWDSAAETTDDDQ